MDSSPSPALKPVFNLRPPRQVHFIGIGGSGMSGLARVLLDAGDVVTGSDSKRNEQTDDLVSRGARVSFQQRGELIGSETQLVVRTAAVRDDNPEYELAIHLGIPTQKYAQLLGEVMRDRFGIAVAGTHGKSTTTAMLCHALVRCGIDPSFVVGGHVPQLGGGSRSGRGPHFIAEACEYDRSFHQLRPRVAIVNNVEAEHLDCYGTIESIIESFRTFAELVPADGLVIGRGDDANVRRVLDGLRRPIETFGIGAGFDWQITPSEVVGGCHHGDVALRGKHVATVRPSIPGRHNLLNATCALAAANACGVDLSAAADAIGAFTGVDRRMTEVGEYRGAIIVDDYGHHPTEVRVTLSALRQKYQPKRLICVFQPHQHSRTRLFLEDFATSFTDADETIVPEIYSVRDSMQDKAEVTSQLLVDRINGASASPDSRAVHISTFPDVIERLRRTLGRGDVIVTMGAGNVNEIGRQLADEPSDEGVTRR